MKVSIVAEGGVFRTAYVMGALKGLYDYFGLKRVDYATGSSVSLSLLSYYIMGRINDAFPIVKKYLSKPPAIGVSNIVKGRPFVNVDYVIDQVLKNDEPTFTDKLSNSQTLFVIPVTNVVTGEAEYFTNRDGYDLLDVMRASLAIPFAYGRSIQIDDGIYVDGGLSDPLPLDLPGIKESKKIIILTKTEKEIKKRSLIGRALLKVAKLKMQPGLYKAFQNTGKVYRKRMAEVKRLEEEGHIVIRPKKKMSRFDRKIETIEKNMVVGYNDTVCNEKIPELIKHLKNSLRRDFYFGGNPNL